MKVHVISFLIIYVLYFCFVSVNSLTPIAKEYTSNSITYVFNKNAATISMIRFNKSDFRLNFQCSTTSLYIYCKTSYSRADAKYFFDIYFYDSNNIINDIPKEDYPPPIIDPPFTPSTKSGVEYLQGIFLYIGSRSVNYYDNNYFEIFSKGKSGTNVPIYGTFNGNSDTSNITIQYPGGCGPSYFLWANSGKTYQYNHSAPVIYSAYFGDLYSIYITGNNFCTMDFKDNIMVTINNKTHTIKSIDHELIVVTPYDYDFVSYTVKEFVIVFITIFGVNSNSIKLYPKLTITTNTSKPSVNGQEIEYMIHNIFKPNQQLTANINITVLNKKYTINSKSELIKPKNTFVVRIPSGCGKFQVGLSIGNQSTISQYQYQSCSISSCNVIGTVESNGTIECIGNFSNDDKSYYLISQDYIQFSNIKTKFSMTNNLISTPLLPEYMSGDVSICGVKVSSITIPPSFNKPNNHQIFKVNDSGSVTISGHHFNQNSIKNTYFKCIDNNYYDYDDNAINMIINCSLISYSSAICKFKDVIGSNDKKCKFTFNGIPNYNDKITIKFLSHSILNITNQINYKDGGVITIIGDQFYNKIDNILIGDRECLNSTYYNDTTLSCYLPPITNFNVTTTTDYTNNSTSIIKTISYEPNVNVSITINGKTNSTTNLLAYNNPNSTTTIEERLNNNSNNINIFITLTIIILLINVLL